MKKKRISQGTKKKLVILVPLSLIALFYFLGTLFYYGYKIYSLKTDKSKLENELYELKDQEDDLKTDIEKLQNPDYLARYARENYHYSKKGELVIQREKKDTVETEEEIEEEDYSEGIAICLVLLLIVLIYILRHKNKKEVKQKRK